MLDTNRKGYAVMSADLEGISFEDESLTTCKGYCRKGYVIVRMTPYVCGFSITFRWFKFYKPFNFRYQPKNILWLHWNWNKEFLHKIGEIVYKNDI